MAENYRSKFKNRNFFSWPIAPIVQGTGTLFDGTKMAAYFRDDGWKEDVFLKEEMSRYIKQGLQRQEILDFLKRDFAQYACIRTVNRLLRYFDIYYNDKNLSVDEVKEAVKKELDLLGKLLGYRAMHHKVQQDHDLNVSRAFVQPYHGRINFGLI